MTNNLVAKKTILTKKSFLSFVSLFLAIICIFYATLFFWQCAYPKKYVGIVQNQIHLGVMTNIEAGLIHAMIWTESGYREKALSKAGAMGLMQITPETFEWAQMRTPEDETLSAENLYDPEINIRYGIIILELLEDMFGSRDTALAAYNAGAGNVSKWLADERYSKDGVTLYYIPFKETREYVKKVRETEKIYNQMAKFE